MPLVNEVFPSKYLGAADLQNKDVLVTIDRVEMEQFEDAGKKVPKPVVYFRGSEKGLVANKTNSVAIADITGQPDTDNWGGARICLFPTMVQFGVKMTEAIRVKRPPAAPAVPDPVAPEVPPVAPVDDMEDSIPW